MRTNALLLVLLLPAAAAGAPPRLGVVVAVDQMRPEYLDRSDLPDGGFRRLRREGARFPYASHLHIPTETGPGHAALSTGRTPATHGIIGNDWYDRRLGRDVYCFADSVYGLGPENMRGPTLADALKAARPGARVFAVSEKDRSAIAFGGRRGDVVLWYDRSKGEFATSGYYRRPSWLGAFNASLRRKAVVAYDAEKKKTPKDAMASPAYDRALELLVDELVAQERVGRGASTDLVMISYSGTDLVGHRWGLETPQMDAQLASLDAILGRLLKRIEKASGGSVALALSGDHGAIHAPEDASGKASGVRRFDWMKFGESMEKALQARWPSDKPWIVSNQVPLVYLNREAAAARGLERGEFFKKAAETLARVDGVAGAYVAGEKGGPFDSQLALSYDPGRSGDVYVMVAENVLLHDMAPGTSHGSPWPYDARVPLLFWGRGVKPGSPDVPAATTDLAPTMARLLGFDYPASDGGAVRLEALAEEAAR
ncbi:MAG: alkaline phosphatase family protein [Elusimicrobiota bacterium]|nr:MAG: alkaline phosphatase family protein [Elusimicrobiota bacterium]